MRIFLLHGMGRSVASMAYLAWRLRQDGHETELFGYLVSTTDLGEIAQRFVERVESVLENDREAGQPAGPYAVIGHSLGNVITRLSSPKLPAGFARFVLLAPPNRPPTLVSHLEGNKLFHWITGDAGRKLADDEFYRDLPVPQVPCLIIAGTGGPKEARLPLGEAENDGILKVEETHLGDLPVLEVPAIHTFLMNRKDVLEAILDFLAEHTESLPTEPVEVDC